MDRFREPGEFSKAAGSNEETLGYRLQAMRAGSWHMAKGSQRGGSRGELSASRGGRANRQSSIRFGWPRQAAEGKGQLGRSAVRQFLATDAGGGPPAPPRNPQNALSPLPLPN